MSGETADETADEWDDPVGETESEVAAGPASFIGWLVGAVLLVASVPGVAAILEGEPLGVYGALGAGGLFLVALAIVYASGQYYGEEKGDVRGES